MWGTDPVYKLDLDAVLGKAAEQQNEFILKPPVVLFHSQEDLGGHRA